MAEPKRVPQPSDSSFDTGNERPSMGDPVFVDTQVRAMFDEARHILFEAPNPQAKVAGLVDKWTKQFVPTNGAYEQCIGANSLGIFLRARGLGTNDDPADLEAPVKALVATTLDRFVTAAINYHEGSTDDEQLQFAIDTAAEDFTALIRGLDNPAD